MEKRAWVDFTAVKAAADMESVLRRYGVELRKAGETSLRGRCPLPTHSSAESKESFGVNTAKKVWACQSRSCMSARGGKKGGNVLDFVALMERCTIRDAALKLQGWFAVDAEPGATPERARVPERNEEPKEEPEVLEAENKPLGFVLKNLDFAHPYLASRGVSRGTTEGFGIGYFSGKGMMAGRVVIPIHNEKGELVAYAGRSVNGTEPKYKLPPGFKKSQVLWNLHQVQATMNTAALTLADPMLAHLAQVGWSGLGGLKGTMYQAIHQEPIVLVEGFFDCVRAWEAGLTAVALMGSSLSEEQRKLLEPFQKVMLMFDGDDAGRTASGEIAARLVRRHFVRIIEVPAGKQPDELSVEEIRALLR